MRHNLIVFKFIMINYNVLFWLFTEALYNILKFVSESQKAWP